MEISLVKKIEYAIDDVLIDIDCEYEKDPKDPIYFLEIGSNSMSQKNVMSIFAVPSGYDIKIISMDIELVEDNMKELTEYCSRVNAAMLRGDKVYIEYETGHLIFNKFVDCVDVNGKGPSPVKVANSLEISRREFEDFIDGALMVNLGITTAENAFELMLERIRKGMAVT